MASVYSTEPPTTGKVILKTNYGNIDIELWTKEAPRACRNFIQLCLEGYYNNLIFHRIIKGFMIQTGDPTGSGNSGQSIWNKDFGDEFHSRLRFSHRGMVAMANKNKPNTNASQFFITLDKCPWLDKKHTIFGKITGDTIFNAINISHLPTKDDFPIDYIAPKVLKAEVIINPFIDIVPRESKLATNSTREDEIDYDKIYDKKELQRKKYEKLTNNNLISFDEDNEEFENENNFKLNKNKKFGIKPLPGLKDGNSLDQVFEKNTEKNPQIIIKNNNKTLQDQTGKGYELILDEKFLDEQGLDEEKLLNYLQLKNNKNNGKSEEKKQEIENEYLSEDSFDKQGENEGLESELLRKKVKEEQRLLRDNQENKIDFDFNQDRKDEMVKIKQDIQQIKKRIKNNNEGKDHEDYEDANTKLTPLQEMRMKYLKNKRPRNPKETAEKINQFVKNLKTLSRQEGSWMSNKLKFHTDSQKAFNMNETKEKVMRNFDLNHL